MMLIPHYLKESPIHGMGLHTGVALAAGQEIWRFVPGFDQLLDEATLPELPPQAYDFITRYAHASRDRPGFLVLEADDARFMNHADAPNCDAGITLRAIAEGEELTCDYRKLPKGT